MSKDKDIKKIKENPKNVRFNELERLIMKAGFKLENVRGSHYLYKRGSTILTIVKPHGGHKHCHWLDVRDVIRILEEE